MLILRLVIAAFIALSGAAALYAIGHFRGWWLKKRPISEHAERLRPHLDVRLPDGEGPFPAVLLLHGCGGVKDSPQKDYAEAALARGVAACVLDSLSPRGITYERALNTVCKGRELLGAERAGDIIAALEILRGRPDIDSERIALVGWSHGAWAIMDLFALDHSRRRPLGVSDAPADPLAGVCGALLYYPFCGFPALTRKQGWTRTDIPARMLLVENDTLADEKVSQRAAERARASGADIDVTLWSGVTHAFDETPHELDSKLRYDADAAARSHDFFADWLSDTVGPRPAP